jgi:hypothetical protein
MGKSHRSKKLLGLVDSAFGYPRIAVVFCQPDFGAKTEEVGQQS